jgi:hypothetical protein
MRPSHREASSAKAVHSCHFMIHPTIETGRLSLALSHCQAVLPRAFPPTSPPASSRLAASLGRVSSKLAF